MEASRTQPADLVGLSRFLIEHERCGAGFDVAHPAGVGSGQVAITCRGCNARHEYATATIEVERELRVEAVSVPAPRAGTRPPEAAASAAPAAAAGPAKGAITGPRRSPAPGPPVAPRQRRRRGASLDALRRSSALTVSLVAIALAAATFAVIRLVSGGDEETAPDRPAATAEAPSPAEPQGEQPPATPPPPSPAEPQGEQPPATPPAQPPAGQPPQPELVRVATSRFELAMPASWSRRTEGGALLLEPRVGGPVSVRVYLERDPGLGIAAMSAATADFLRSRAPGASVSEPKRLQVAGDPAFELRASGGGRQETARGVLSGPYRYLLLESVLNGAPAARVGEADRVLASFRPR